MLGALREVGGGGVAKGEEALAGSGEREAGPA